MIASIDYQRDIKIFLEREDLELLRERVIKGTLVKMLEPEKQGTLTISLNEKLTERTGQGIQVDMSKYFGVEEDFLIIVYIGHQRYSELREEGMFGTRYNTGGGNKIDIYDKTRIEGSLVMYTEDLEEYIIDKRRN